MPVRLLWLVANLTASWTLTHIHTHRQSVSHTHLGNFHFVNTADAVRHVTETLRLRLRLQLRLGLSPRLLTFLWKAASGTAPPPPPPPDGAEKPPKTLRESTLGNCKREINLYINCVKWICLQFKRLSILSSPLAVVVAVIPLVAVVAVQAWTAPRTDLVNLSAFALAKSVFQLRS